MAGKKTGKRLLTWVLVLVMALSLLPLNVLAANGPETDSSSGMNFTKELLPDQPDDDGNYTIRMTAQATGTTTTTTKVEPMDIVLVLDQSGSMADDFGNGTRQSAMKAAVNSFIGEVADKYSPNADHRMAIVTFGTKARILAGWTSVDEDGEAALTGEISGLTDSPSGATNVGAGMQAAQTLMGSDYNYTGGNTDRLKTVIVFTDGVPTKQSDFNTEVANTAISAAKAMKVSDVTIYTVGIFNGANPTEMYGASGFDTNSDGTVNSEWAEDNWGLFPSTDFPKADRPAGNRFLNLVSSNYPNADSIGLKRETSGLGILHSGISYKITKNFNRVAEGDYYLTASDASSLEKIFKDISTMVPEPDNAELNGDTVITDTLSDYFTFAGTAEDVKVYAIDANGNKKESEDAAKVKPVVTGKTVTVTGYDFSKHHTESDDPEELVIEIKVKPDPAATWGPSDKYETNKDNATVTLPNSEANPIAKAESPKAHVDTYKVTYQPGEGSGDEYTDQHYLNGAKTKVLENRFAAQEGYEFDCWKDENDTTYQVGDEITFDKSNVTLTAQWREIEAADLSVEKTVTRINGSTPTTDANGNITTIAYPGDEIEWTITVANSGNATGNFTLKDVLKGRTDELTVSPAMAEGANSYTIAPKNPTTGEPTTMTFTVTYTVQPADVTGNGLVNTVTMNGTSVESALVPTAQKYTVTGTIDNDGTVTNPSQKLKPGEKSTAMTFAPADGYKITSVTVNGTAVSDLTLNSDGSYTYPAMDSVTENIAVNVKTDKRTDLSYTVKYVNKITGSEIQKSVVKNGKTFGDTITGESEKVSIANYTYVEANPDLLTIGTDATKNVITLYYTKDAPTPGTFDFNDVIPDDGKNTPAITKTVKGNVGRNFKETFKVAVEPKSENAIDTMSSARYTGEAKVTYSGLKDIAFLFTANDKLTFRNEGKYIYTVWEIPDGTSRMSYDTTKYPLTIKVVLNKNTNKYEVESWQFTAGNRENLTQLNIVNTYRAYHPSTPSKPTLNTGDHYAYVMGYPDGTVRPNGSITRAEVSAILFRLLSDETRDEYFTTESSFTDVKAGAWYNNSIATLEKAGVIVDTAKGGAFRPNEAITRAELAAMLAQFSDAKPVKGVKFSDVSAEHWAYEAIAIAAKMGWIEGYPDGTFRPDATITRAEMMTLVNRALERVPSDEDHLLSKRVMLTFPDCKSGDWFYIAVQEATNSHTYERAATEKNGDEQWTALRANRDWTQLEK